MSFLAEIFGKMLAAIYGLIPNFGVTIILFAIFTRALLVPFYFKQIKSSRITMKLQPKIKALQKKYANDRNTLNVKMLELYKANNYSPMAGCLPAILQIILVLGMFSALRQPELYVFTDQAVLNEATNQLFLWIPNLSQPDLLSNVISTDVISIADKLPGIMPIISAIATYFSIAQNPTMSAPPKTDLNQVPGQTEPLAGMNRIMKIMFPGLILLYGVSFTGGIVLYWTVGTIFSMVQQVIVNKILEGQEEFQN